MHTSRRLLVPFRARRQIAEAIAITAVIVALPVSRAEAQLRTVAVPGQNDTYSVLLGENFRAFTDRVPRTAHGPRQHRRTAAILSTMPERERPGIRSLEHR